MVEFEQSALLGVEHDGGGGAVFDGAAGVGPLDFAQDWIWTPGRCAVSRSRLSSGVLPMRSSRVTPSDRVVAIIQRSPFVRILSHHPSASGRSAPIRLPGRRPRAEYRLKAASGCATVKVESNVSNPMAKKTPPETLPTRWQRSPDTNLMYLLPKTVQATALKPFRSANTALRRRLRPLRTARPMVLARPGWLLGGQIARLVDKGYQKFLKTPKMEIPATADHLRAIHEFSEELNEAAGGDEPVQRIAGDDQRPLFV